MVIVVLFTQIQAEVRPLFNMGGRSHLGFKYKTGGGEEAGSSCSFNSSPKPRLRADISICTSAHLFKFGLFIFSFIDMAHLYQALNIVSNL